VFGDKRKFINEVQMNQTEYYDAEAEKIDSDRRGTSDLFEKLSQDSFAEDDLDYLPEARHSSGRDSMPKLGSKSTIRLKSIKTIWEKKNRLNSQAVSDHEENSEVEITPQKAFLDTPQAKL